MNKESFQSNNVINENTISLIEKIKNLNDNEVVQFKSASSSNKAYIKNTKKFFKDFLIDINDEVVRHEQKKFFCTGKYISAFKVPCQTKQNVNPGIYSYINNDSEYVPLKIEMSEDNITPLDATYAHEIVHALTERNTNQNLNYIEKEFLSILLEKFYMKVTYDKEYYQMYTKNRWLDIKGTVDDLEKEGDIRVKQYFYANVAANYVVDLFENSDELVKDGIVRNISNALNGIISVEDLIVMYNLNLDNKDLFISSDNTIQAPSSKAI